MFSRLFFNLLKKEYYHVGILNYILWKNVIIVKQISADFKISQKINGLTF